MKKLLLLALFAFVPRLTAAQEVKGAVAGEKVTYSRAVPKSLHAFVPRGGKSRFWGATNLQFKGKRVWAHVYDVDNHNKSNYQKRGLDLFAFNKTHQLVRVSSTRFECMKGPGEAVGVEILWLNPQTRKVPIIKVAFQCVGLLGPITDYVFFVFNQNLKNAVVQKQFGSGNSNASDWATWNTSFGVDERGLLTIIYYQGGTLGGRITTYRWKENLFKPFERRQQADMGENTPYLPVPLTDD